MKRSLQLVAFLIALPFGTAAQDIHFSQFFNAPMALGPGHIGQFDGEKRAHAIFRQQWRSVTIPYRTFGVGGDMRNAFGVKGLGMGVWAFNDRAGDSRLNQFHLNVGASWTQTFGAGDEHALTVGLQVGITSLTLDNGGLSFDAQYNGFYYDPARDNEEGFTRSGMVHPDVNLGAVYTYRPAPRQLFRIGFGAFNLTTPRIGFLGEPGVPLDRRTDVHMMFGFPLGEKLDLLPMVRSMAQGTFRELNIGSNVRYTMLERYGVKRAVLAGLHGRSRDAGYLYAGFEYDDWTFGASYDINTSDLVPASRNRGAIEFSVIRIWKKRPLIPARFKACPDQL